MEFIEQKWYDGVGAVAVGIVDATHVRYTNYTFCSLAHSLNHPFVHSFTSNKTFLLHGRQFQSCSYARLH